MATQATPDDVKRLAALARISIPEEQLPALAAEFDSILAYIGQLDELSIDRAASPSDLQVQNVTRADADPHEKGAWTDALVAQFPAREGNALAVKQIISHD